MNKDSDKYFIHGFIYKDKVGDKFSDKSSASLAILIKLLFLSDIGGKKTYSLWNTNWEFRSAM